jgi:lipoprotein-anchoring transpeptidase ErfK/SrfK
MNTLFSNGRVRLFVTVWLLLLLVSVGLFIFFFAASPANSSISNLFGPTPAPTQENLWAFADFPKPTYTPIPVIPALVPTDSVLPTVPTETAGAMAMEIVGDSPVSANANMAPVGGSVTSYGGSKYILVDLSEQHMYVYAGDALIYSFVASTGINGGTRIGNFAVQSKIPNAYGSTWDIWMPDWLGIYWSGGLENGIHALPILPNGATLWAGFLGRPISYGCVVLGTYDAQVLYDWADMGTPVDIQW